MYLLVYDVAGEYVPIDVYDIGDNDMEEMQDFVTEVKKEWTDTDSDEYLSVFIEQKMREKGCKPVDFDTVFV